MIKGVKIKELKVVPDERGWLMEVLRCDDDCFDKFVEPVYSLGSKNISVAEETLTAYPLKDSITELKVQSLPS